MRASTIAVLVGTALVVGMWGAATERSRNAGDDWASRGHPGGESNAGDDWAPRGHPGGESIVQHSRAVVIDVETTGFSPDADRIVAVGAVSVDFSRLDGEFVAGDHATMEFTVDPGIPIPWGASAVHGIVDDDVKGLPAFADVAGELREAIGDLVVVGHNVAFDIRFLNAEFRRAGERTLEGNETFCTMTHFGRLNPGLGRGLDDVARALGVEGRAQDRHNALEDAVVTARIAARLLAAGD